LIRREICPLSGRLTFRFSGGAAAPSAATGCYEYSGEGDRSFRLNVTDYSGLT
jgi:hypothetical protein